MGKNGSKKEKKKGELSCLLINCLVSELIKKEKERRKNMVEYKFVLLNYD